MLLGRLSNINLMRRNPQRSEQKLIRIVHSNHASRLIKNPRQNMNANRRITELPCHPLTPAKKIQRSVSPVFTRANLRPWVALTFIRSPHRKQIFNRHLINSLLTALHHIFRKIIQHLIVYTSNLPFINRNANQQCKNTLSHRHYMRAVVHFVAVPAVRVNFFAALVRYHLADVRLLRFNQFVQFVFVHNHSLFWSIYFDF